MEPVPPSTAQVGARRRVQKQEHERTLDSNSPQLSPSSIMRMRPTPPALCDVPSSSLPTMALQGGEHNQRQGDENQSARVLVQQTTRLCCTFAALWLHAEQQAERSPGPRCWPKTPQGPTAGQPATAARSDLMCAGRVMRPALLIICSVCTPSSIVIRLRGSGMSLMPLSAARAACKERKEGKEGQGNARRHWVTVRSE